MQRILDSNRKHLNDLAGRRVMTTPVAYIDTKRIDLDRVRARLIFACDQYTGSLRKQHVHYAAKLDALSPLKVLARGYSIARNADGTPLRTAAQVSPGEKIDLTLSDGALRCAVEEVYHGHNEETAGL